MSHPAFRIVVETDPPLDPPGRALGVLLGRPWIRVATAVEPTLDVVSTDRNRAA